MAMTSVISVIMNELQMYQFYVTNPALIEYEMICRTLFESSGSDDAERSSLLRMLRLRYHHRFEPETVAHRSECIAVVVHHYEHGSFSQTESYRRHSERRFTS